jgi:hypothetical protein
VADGGWRRCVALGLALCLAGAGEAAARGGHGHGFHHGHHHHHRHGGGFFGFGFFGGWPGYPYYPYYPSYSYGEQTIYGPAAPAAGPPPSDYCREYEADATIDGRQQRVTGVACWRPDGTWQILTQTPVP